MSSSFCRGHLLAQEEISGGSSDGTGNTVPIGKSDVGQESIGAGDDLPDRILAVPVERPAKVWMFEKVARVERSGSDHVAPKELSALIGCLSTMMVEHRHVGNILKGGASKIGAIDVVSVLSGADQ